MNWIWTAAGLIAGAAGAWYLVRFSLKTQYGARVQMLDAKLRLKEAEVGDLKTKVIHLDGQVGLLTQTLQEERQAKKNEISELNQSFKNGLMVVSLVCLGFGLSFGGFSGWWAGKTLERAANTESNVMAKLKLQQYQLKAALFSKKSAELEKQVMNLNRELDREKISRAVFETKLNILLESLDESDRGRGMVIDFSKLKKNLRKEFRVGESPQNTVSLSAANR